MSAHRLVATGAATAVVLVGVGAAGTSQAAGPQGAVQIVQAVPDAAVSVSVDGKSVSRGLETGAVLGPIRLAPGKHSVTFVAATGEVRMNASVSVKPGSSTDVVLHRPASVDGRPVVNVYRTPRSPIGPGKARVLVAHTATVAPADVRVDGKTVFTNIANGEFAQADVPAGTHEVALLPTGQTDHPILGPLDVSLAARTVTMVYAVGTPANGSMNVIAHTARIRADGTVVPDTITTGSAGLAAGFRVGPFTSDPEPTPPATAPSMPEGGLAAGAVLLVLLVGAALVRGRDRVSTGVRSPARD